MKTTEDLAREAGIPPIYYAGTDISSEVTRRGLERFAALVRAQALATVAEFIAASDEYEGTLGMNGTDDENGALLDSVSGRYVRAAAAIRALAGAPASKGE